MTATYRPFAFAGLLPAFAALVVAVAGEDWRWTAIAAGYGYSTLIFSFLGGVWWGWGLARGLSGIGPWIVAVMPSLIAFATYLPWILGWTWPGPSLLVLGFCIIASPLVDRWIGIDETGWLSLRWQLSTGLG